MSNDKIKEVQTSMLTPTMELRWLQEVITAPYGTDIDGNTTYSLVETKMTLQQAWVDQDGNKMWIDVPIDHL